MAGGGPVGQVASNINSSNPPGPQQGQGTLPYQPGQMDPNFGKNPFGQPRNQGPGTNNQFGGSFGGGQQPAMLSDMQKPAVLGDMQYRPDFGGQFQPRQNPFQPQQPFGAQVPHTGGQRRNEVFDQFARAGRLDEYYREMQDLQNSANQTARPMQQPQQPAFGQSPEYQGYQTQMQGLQQQMDEYMRKAPMYQQLQDLQGKMQGYQQRQQQAMQQQMMQRPSPFRQNPYQQRFGGGIQGLMGMMGGRGGMGMASPGSYEQYADANNQAFARPTQEVKRPTMSRADFNARNIMSMGMPQASGFESNYRAFMKNGGKV